MNHMLTEMPAPAAESNFALLDSLYPFEKASDWHRSYLTAAMEHLLLWADFAAPLKFDPAHEVIFRARPAHTMGRAAMEAASQAIWITDTLSIKESVRRHLALIRWDYVEHRKSQAALEHKKRISEMDAKLLKRVDGYFDESDLKPPSHLDVLRAAAPAVDLDPDEVESVWRAASGAAHGKAWAGTSLQHVIPISEYEPGQFRTLRVPDADAMAQVLQVAEKMLSYGVLRHADFCQADIKSMLGRARHWLGSVIPFRDDADPAIVSDLRRGPDEPSRLI